MVVDRQRAFLFHKNSLPSVDQFMWGSRCFSCFFLFLLLMVLLLWDGRERVKDKVVDACLEMWGHQPAFWISGDSSPWFTCSKTDCSSEIVGFYLRILLSIITIWTCTWLLATVLPCIGHINSHKKSDQLFYSCIGSMCCVHICPVW